MPDEFVKVASVEAVPPGEMTAVEVNGEGVLLVNLEGEYYALSEECTHAYGRLSMGTLKGHEVKCPSHDAWFNLKTGDAVTRPAIYPLVRYEVRVEGGDILVGPPV